MQTIAQAAIALFAITVRLYQDDYRGVDDSSLIIAIFFYQTAVSILLLNLLIAQLQCSYEYVNQDAIGFARLTRSMIISENIKNIPRSKWDEFVAGLKFDQKLEFSQGDVGISGGIQVMEPANIHVSVEESIFRFGGDCSPELRWPEENTDTNDEEEDSKFDRLEQLLQKTIKKMAHMGSTASKQKLTQGSRDTRTKSDDDASKASGSVASSAAEEEE